MISYEDRAPYHRTAARFGSSCLLIIAVSCVTGRATAQEAVSGSEVKTAVLQTELFAVDNDFPVALISCNNDQSCRCPRCDPNESLDTSLEIGLNGAEGDSRNINLVVGLDVKQESGLDTLTQDLDYLFSRDESEVTKNRVYSLTRWERDIPDSNWGTFVDGWFEYDELETFRARIGFHTGGVVTMTKTKSRLIKGMFGFGTSKEMAGNDMEWKPEGFLGGLLEKKINSRQSCYIKAVIYPDVANLSDFRVNARAGWEYALSTEKDVKLSLSAFDRYDATVALGDRRNNVDYWASVIWSF